MDNNSNRTFSPRVRSPRREEEEDRQERPEPWKARQTAKKKKQHISEFLDLNNSYKTVFTQREQPQVKDDDHDVISTPTEATAIAHFA